VAQTMRCRLVYAPLHHGPHIWQLVSAADFIAICTLLVEGRASKMEGPLAPFWPVVQEGTNTNNREQVS
jgi:hypothetical protein